MDLSIKTEAFQQDDQSWLGSAHGTDTGRSVTLDVSLFTAATHYPNGYLPSGLPLAPVTASGRFGPYDGAAVDGRGALAGHLLSPLQVPEDTSKPVSGSLLDHGRVRVGKLPVALDAAGQADAAGRIVYV